MEERERSAEDLLKEMRVLGEKINSEDEVVFEKVKRKWVTDHFTLHSGCVNMPNLLTTSDVGLIHVI